MKNVAPLNVHLSKIDLDIMKTLISRNTCSIYFKTEIPNYAEFCRIYHILPGTNFQSALRVDTLMTELFKLPRTDVKEAYLLMILTLTGHHFKVPTLLTCIREHYSEPSSGIYLQFIPPVSGYFTLEGPKITIGQFKKGFEKLNGAASYYTRFVDLYNGYSKDE